jgi:hypothetical protein
MLLYSIIVSIIWAGGISFILLKGIDMTIGLRVSAEDEDAGLDSSIHGETIDIASVDKLSIVQENELDKKWASARSKDELDSSVNGKVIPLENVEP